MRTFLKVFFGLILLGIGCFVLVAAPLVGIIGPGAFIVQVIIGIAMIAGGYYPLYHSGAIAKRTEETKMYSFCRQRS
jgi:hypothetical protein